MTAPKKSIRPMGRAAGMASIAPKEKKEAKSFLAGLFEDLFGD